MIASVRPLSLDLLPVCLSCRSLKLKFVLFFARSPVASLIPDSFSVRLILPTVRPSPPLRSSTILRVLSPKRGGGIATDHHVLATLSIPLTRHVVQLVPTRISWWCPYYRSSAIVIYRQHKVPQICESSIVRATIKVRSK
jgi:hypothetical protein